MKEENNMKQDIMLIIFITSMATLAGKILFDYFQTGRAEKGKYATRKELANVIQHCADYRQSCCLPQIKQQVSTLEERSHHENSMMLEVREDFKNMRLELQKHGVQLGEIKISIKSLLAQQGKRDI